MTENLSIAMNPVQVKYAGGEMPQGVFRDPYVSRPEAEKTGTLISQGMYSHYGKKDVWS